MPKAPVEPFYLKDVTLTVNFAGSVSLDGNVTFVTKDDDKVKGSMHLTLALAPSFKATGKITATGDLPSLSFSATDTAGFTAHHFTAQGTGSLDIDLLKGSGDEVLSDAGFGASGKVCAPHILGFKTYCQTLGFAATWAQFGKLVHLDLGVLHDIVGADPQKLVTVHVAAAAQSAIRVPSGRNHAAGVGDRLVREPGPGADDPSRPAVHLNVAAGASDLWF